MDNSGIIDFSALERELQAAVEADEKYHRENEAKFRAVQQNVATYEEFRDIVLASHLKPLDKQDKANAPRKQPWNPVSAGNKERTAPTPEIIQTALSDFQPRTSSEFMRDWRRLDGGSLEKYGLLLRLGGGVLQGVFSAEVGFGLLGEFLVIISECLQSGDEAAVIGLLEGLSKTGRFGLNVSLLSKAEKEACRELFCRLWKTVEVDCTSHQIQDKPSEESNRHHIIKCLMDKYGICEIMS
ncbi:coiled-coil domain-containing protein 103 [Astyanax mexicanus]|uniref:Coiled-coil domain-containing protein 103 n=1 Tax=Astyanax mexicanus TaxID=7994 RepID=A0A8T2L517_ASTMX|nr:coiled-coil domain-containing protein 103 [Astyanax mexicanus]KAG9264071.1 coiled-coil domain-containing protein 103 [Astyanax mexicanus]